MSDPGDINTQPDEATQWYRENQSATLAQVEGRLNELSSGYDALQNTWNELGAKEEEAHQALDTRELIRIERERARIETEAAQIHNGYSALQNEKARLAQNPDPKFDDILNSSSQPSQMFLRVHRAQLEKDPARLRQLIFSHARAVASGLKPDSANYFKAIEAACGFDPADRDLSDFDDSAEMQQARNATKRDDKPKAPESTATEAQRVMSQNLPGVSPDEYLTACAQPFSQAAQTVSLEPDEHLDFGNNSKPMEVSFDEAPKQPPARYKAPNPKTSVTLSPAELALIENMAVQTNTPLAEARKSFAQQKLLLHSGKSSQMLYQDRLKAMGQA